MRKRKLRIFYREERARYYETITIFTEIYSKTSTTMMHFRKTLTLIIAAFMLSASSNYCMAENSGEIKSKEDLVWLEDKEEVFNIAKEEGKLILLMVGRHDCPSCISTTRLLNEEPLRPLIDDNYILWFSNRRDNESRAEVLVYTSDIEPLIAIEAETKDYTILLPLLYTIDPNEPDKYITTEYNGYDSEKSPGLLKTMLEDGMVSNDYTHSSKQKVFISNNSLYIYNDITDEDIHIYSIDGKHITTIHKREHRLTIDVSGFPKGILVVYSSKKWGHKILNN